MAEEQKKIIPINYTNREFRTIREDLMEIAERLYPDSFLPGYSCRFSNRSDPVKCGFSPLHSDRTRH